MHTIKLVQESPSSTPASHHSLETSDHSHVTQYVMDCDGDHSLNIVTVVEQGVGAFSRYTVRLRLASGAEQSIAITAPPGGLQLEMHDMTGDRISNDLIVRPALLRWLPTILLNDGHDHFAVAISGLEQGSVSARQELASRGSDDEGSVALLSSGFKVGGLVNEEGFLLPLAYEEFLSSTTRTISQSSCHSSSSGRAPPSFLISA